MTAFMDRSPAERRVIDQQHEHVFGMTATHALEKGLCARCHQTALHKCHTEQGRRDYKQTALCEECDTDIIMEGQHGNNVRS